MASPSTSPTGYQATSPDNSPAARYRRFLATLKPPEPSTAELDLMEKVNGVALDMIAGRSDREPYVLPSWENPQLTHTLVVDPRHTPARVFLLKTGDRIGRGSFKHVCKAWETSTQKCHAASLIKKVSDAACRTIQAELEFLALFNGVPGIVPLVCVVEIPEFKKGEVHYVPAVCLIQPYCPGGDLAAAIRSGIVADFPREIRLDLAHQLLCVMAFVHRSGVLHRDLKPSNLVFDSTPNGRPALKVIDWGLAARTNDAKAAELCVGTPAYMSPLQHMLAFMPSLMPQATGEAGDVWALGCVFMELGMGSFLPWHHHGDREKTKKDLVELATVQGRKGHLFQTISVALSDKFSETHPFWLLIREMMKLDPHLRGSMAGALERFETRCREQRIQIGPEPLASAAASDA